MWFVRKTAEFFCAKCYATGRLPVVEGDACCPECGERVWTVKRFNQPLDRNRSITPDYRLPILSHRPQMPMRGRWVAKLCVYFFPEQIGRWLARRDERIHAHISALFRQLETCHTRAEYEAVLGRPVHAVSGKGCGTLRPDGIIINEPDTIEHYRCGDCCIDLFFKDDTVQEKWGYINPTPFYVEFRRHEDAKRP